MTTGRRTARGSSQQGGLTIIMALVLVGVMGAAAFSLSRNAIRELSMAGTIVQGGKAGAAADAGLDWVIIWAQGSVSKSAFDGASPVTGELTLYTKMNDILGSTTGHFPATLVGSADPAMTLDHGGTAPSKQDFDIEIRYLGDLPATSVPGSENSSNSAASGNTQGGASSFPDHVWRMVSTGRATPNGTTQTYTAQRELMATVPYSTK